MWYKTTMSSIVKIFILVILAFLPAVSSAGVKNVRACLTDHIHDAMNLNKARASAYALLTDGKSSPISKKLIRMERWLSLAVPFADAWAAPFQAAGVNILCDDFIDMSLTPAFRAMNPAGKDNVANFRRADEKILIKNLDALLDENNFIGLGDYADEQIRLLDQNPRYNCMVKHVLESIRRMAYLAPKHNRLAKQKIKISSLSLSRIVLRNHINMLDTSAEIDQLAAPLQADGLPIICQDVPYIPVP